MPGNDVTGPVQHRNEVLLVGRMAADPAVVELPSGDSVVTIRLVVQRPDPPPTGRGRTRVDTLNSAAWDGHLRDAVLSWQVGDTVEVTGSIRRRFWRSPAGLASRYELEMASGRRLVRIGSAASPSADSAGLDEPQDQPGARLGAE